VRCQSQQLILSHGDAHFFESLHNGGIALCAVVGDLGRRRPESNTGSNRRSNGESNTESNRRSNAESNTDSNRRSNSVSNGESKGDPSGESSGEFGNKSSWNFKPTSHSGGKLYGQRQNR